MPTSLPREKYSLKMHALYQMGISFALMITLMLGNIVLRTGVDLLSC